MNLDSHVTNVYTTIETITANIDTIDVADLVEAGAALNALSSRIEARLKEIKDRLRTIAEDEGLTIGTLHFDGTTDGKATVTIAKPSVVLGQNADVPLLQQVLGDQFPTYFEEKTTYKVRTGAMDNMTKIASADKRDLVLKHVQIKEATPRVSFHRN